MNRAPSARVSTARSQTCLQMAGVVLGGLAGLGLVGGQVVHAASSPAASEEAAPAKQDEIQAFNLASFTDEGQKRWEVLGRTAHLTNAIIELVDVTATAYGEEANVTLTAREGTFDRENQHVELRQDVKAVTTEGTTLTTQTLNWDAEQQLASTTDWATVQRDAITVQGQGATGSPALKTVRFQEQVQVDVQPATQITCRGPLEVDYERNRARFWRDVHVRDPRGEIWADRMDVRLDPKTRQLTEVQCWGHVRIKQQAQMARAHRAIYQQHTGKIMLIGHPRVAFSPGEEQNPLPSGLNRAK